MALKTGSKTPSEGDTDPRKATERAQRAEANKHTAVVCETHGVQPAVCGCEPEGEKG